MIVEALRRPLVLASTSPQRSAILTALGVPFTAVAPGYVEVDPPGAQPAELALRHARGKAASVPGDLVLGVDTVVWLDGRVLGKPADRAAAAASVAALSGRTHEVHSGLALRAAGREIIRSAVTRVRFRALAAEDVEWYLDMGEWQDRAGGYAVQGAGAALVEALDGDYTNVVGLPVGALIEALAEAAGR